MLKDFRGYRYNLIEMDRATGLYHCLDDNSRLRLPNFNLEQMGFTPC